MTNSLTYASTVAAFVLGSGTIWLAYAVRLCRLRRLLDTDALTDLSNRRAFYRRGPQLLRQGRRRGQAVAVVLVDLNDFKPVNDTYGHAIGDQVLIHVALGLRHSLSGHGVIARLGGDEFAAIILVPTQEQDPHTWLHVFLMQAVQRINTLVTIGQNHVQVSVSMGAITSSPSDTVELSVLLHRADKAMYDAKRQRIWLGFGSSADHIPYVPARAFDRYRDYTRQWRTHTESQIPPRRRAIHTPYPS